jgi:hypothetical protein
MVVVGPSAGRAALEVTKFIYFAHCTYVLE